MKRLTSGVLLLGAVVATASCNNVTGDLAQGPTKLVVSPNPGKFALGKSTTVVVQNFDDQGSALLSNAAVSGAPTGPITVVVDTSFQPGAVQRYASQFLVTATGYGIGLVSFTDAGLAAHQDTMIVLPSDDNALGTLSNTTPNVGDTISMTLPAGPFRFDSVDSKGVQVVITIATGILDPRFATQVLKVDAAAPWLSGDSMTVSFIVPDTLIPRTAPLPPLVAHYDAPVSITGSHIQFSPAYPFGLQGSFAIQSSANLVLP
jgi:hypothetical protein